MPYTASEIPRPDGIRNLTGENIKTLITGGDGQLGLALRRVFGRAGEVRSPDLPDLDVTSRDAVDTFLSEFKPDVVVHAAAMTDVDGCESDREKAFLVNEIGSRHVAESCRAFGARLVAVSTDFVFDGKKECPYDEQDTPAPLSVYGESKLAGERAVLDTLPGATVARTAWLYGAGGTGNFVCSIVKAARSGRTLRVVDDQVGSPTLADDLAEGLYSLVERKGEGIYHVVNGGAVTRYDFARAIVELSGLGSVAIEPVGSGDLGLPATRPANSVLACERLKELGVPPLRHWRNALQDFLTRKGVDDV